MVYEKKYDGLRWALFVPLSLVFSGIVFAVVKTIPIYWILNKLFDLGNANPFDTKHVSGPFGFLLVYIMYSISVKIAYLVAIRITSKPKLAWKILWVIQSIPFLVLI